ncbi:MAG: lipoate--protein ligase [Intestinibacter sp.]|uniref:lipoate--protein ligase family protein n=1 Tax=Intestinibacter sp. TaxID=1965304 RepID=UPI002A8311B6|nr:lipoate--protein ligase [Intestinibacter sp.]MDY4576356.1 lipoate--protein ligase [Intestinibacter sp.]
MLYLVSDYKNPYFNIALEEYLFSSDNFDDDIIIVWRNEESIFLGKNQNPYVEIAHSLINDRKIPLLRRISGGGTVYHDLGNVNMTFIQKNVKLDKIDFIKYTKFMQEMLGYFGVKATYSDRKDLLVDGKKISGSAQCIRGNKCLYHGTLLFSSNLNNLSEFLNTNKNATSNATKSVRSEVTNLNQYIDMGVEEFIEKIKEYIILNVEAPDQIVLNDEDLEKISQNAEQIYSKDRWIFEKTPKFDICIDGEDNSVVEISVNKWRVKSFIIKYKNSDKQVMLNKFIGELFFEKNIMEIANEEYRQYIDIIKAVF